MSDLNNILQMMQNILSGMGMIQPDADTQRALRAASHNNARVFKAWDLFHTLVANGENGTSAMRKVEEAMYAWNEYEDKNWIDPPIPVIPQPAFMPYRTPPIQSYGIAIDPDDPSVSVAKIMEHEPGMPMIFENSEKATLTAQALTEATGKRHVCIEFSTHCLGPIVPQQVDAEFTGQP